MILPEVWPIRNQKVWPIGNRRDWPFVACKFGRSGTLSDRQVLWPFRNQSLALSEPKFGPFGTVTMVLSMKKRA